MTHIKQNIQEDSLIFMDILIQKTPTLFPNYFIKIFPSFLNLISKIHNESKLDRKLSTTLNSKQTTVKWRTKVLQRLEDLLNAVVFKDNNRDLLNIKKVYVDKKYDNSCYNFFPLYNYNIIQSNVPLSMFCNVNTLNHGEDVLLKSVNSIIPLLFAIWIECKPNDENFLFGKYLKVKQKSIAGNIKKINSVDVKATILNQFKMVHGVVTRDGPTRFWFHIRPYSMSHPRTATLTQLNSKQ